MLAKLTAYIRTHHVGLIALVVAMTGTAVAATKVGPHDLAKNAVHSYHVKNGQLGVKDLRKIKTTDQVTTLIPDADPNDDNWGVGIARATCSKGSLAIGVRTDWLAGSQPLAVSSISMHGREAVVAGITDGGGAGSNTARLAIRTSCLPSGP